MSNGIKILIIGCGAREDAISKAYQENNQVGEIVVAPGNDFIPFGREGVSIDGNFPLTDVNSMLEIAKKHKPDLIDVAQDDALASGAVDLLREEGFKVFGPTRNAARIEWDKGWSREFMKRHDIPCPSFKEFDDKYLDLATKHLQEIYCKDPKKLLYVKAAGLCGGKGALKSMNLGEALNHIGTMQKFGVAGKNFLIEEGLIGEEFSFYVMSDGKNYVVLGSAQDHKTVFNFDEGEQTGGMGAISPAMVTASVLNEINKDLVSRTIKGMAEEGFPYEGILYVGGIVVDGKPFVIEFNARWGDPECQVVIPSLGGNYVNLVMASLEGKLAKTKFIQDDKTRVCVVGGSRGYPGDYSGVKGKRIYGIEDALKMEGITLLSSGIKVQDGKLSTNGGRLFSIVAEGDNVIDARERAYATISRISIEGNNLHYRTDIGYRDVKRFRDLK